MKTPGRRWRSERRRPTARRGLRLRPATALFAAALGFGLLAGATAGLAAEPSIDLQRSLVKVHVESAGLLAVFAHRHLISALLAGGRLRASGTPDLEVYFEARALAVEDPELSPADRSQVQATMLGPQVLDVERHPEIRFRSTAVEPRDAATWSVEGVLALHGQTRPLRFTVERRDGHYEGSVILKQTDFGIVPIRLAAGTVRVRDEIRIDFQIVLVERET
ncbi:MAG TPA: YceI family protein [Thermoanaerobaculia bacterium]|nr:YceI family protein [Thermoanaerobaculia bacterium]